VIKSTAIIPSDYLRSGRSNLTDLRENVLILTFFLIGGSTSVVYIFISTYIMNTGHEKTIGKKTESFHRDRAVATLIKYLLLLLLYGFKHAVYIILLLFSLRLSLGLLITLYISSFNCRPYRRREW